MLGSSEARALHATYPAIDLHADTLMWARWTGYRLDRRHRPPLLRAAFMGHVDAPRMVEGGLGAQFFGLVSLPVAHRGMARVIDEQIDELDRQVAAHPAALCKVTSVAEIDAALARGQSAALLGIEGAHALEGDLDRVEHFARRGVRYLGVVHFSRNEAGCPAYGHGRADAAGLSPWGRDLVAACEAQGVVVDLAHLNRTGFLQACAMATRPPIVSHTGVCGAYPHWRNIDDAQIRAVGDKGGVVGVIFCPRFLGGSALADVVRHLAHVIDVGGEDVAALGSDWDGMIVPTPALRDAAHLPQLTDALLQAGYGERVIGKVLRRNVVRVLQACPPRRALPS